MLNDPVQYTGTDFVPFYAAAQIAKNESPSQIYDLDLQKKYEEKLLGFEISELAVNIFVNPPFVIPLVSLFSISTFKCSLILWEVLMTLFFLIGTAILFHLMDKVVPEKALLIFMVGILFFFPGFKSLVIGQNSAMLYLGACLWVYGLLTHKDWLAGLGLALMTVRPHIALPLALPFIFKRRSVWWWFIMGASSLAIFSIIYTGMDGILGFLRILTVSAKGINSTIQERSMVNLIGVFIRLFPELPRSIYQSIGWGVYLISSISLCVLWIKSININGKQIGLAILITTFSVPHMHMHDLVLWSIPLVLILLSVKEKPLLLNKLASFPWWFSLAFLLCFFSPILEAVIPYLILIFLTLALTIPEKFFSWSIFKQEVFHEILS
jgi:hypothetical protein